MTRPIRSLPAVALAMALVAGAATAADPPRDAGAEKALAQAREELRRAAERVAELSRDNAHIARLARERAVQVRNRAVIGVLLAPDDREGVRITGVTPDGGAAKAGLKSGDRLTSVDGVQILGSDGALRLDNARKLLGGIEAGKQVRLGYVREGRDASVVVTPQRNTRVFAFKTGDGGDFEWLDDGEIERSVASAMKGIDGSLAALEALPGIAPDIRREVIRIGDAGACKGDDCKAPRLLSAFRWNGLNLAALDPQLGRYFGTDKGVLVLSSGELDGLQAGDVIQRVDGKAVDSPRAVMDVLRGKGDGDKVAIDYLRDRKSGQARVTIPKLAWPVPPAPPAPPAPPSPPAPPKAAPPPAPPAPPRVAFIEGSDAIVYVATRDAVMQTSRD